MLFQSFFASAQLSPQQQKNLSAFAHLYGYVHYFHPSDEAAALNWNGFAKYGAEQMLTVTNDKDLVRTLNQLFHSVAPSVQVYRSDNPLPFSVTSITPPNTNSYQVIAWQHKGWGVETGSNSAYQSIRLNRPGKSVKTNAGFAPVVQSVPADSLLGKPFRFHGWMKVKADDGGSGHFWLRVDKEKGTGFFYNMDDRPATENSWKEYSFSGTIDKDGKTIVLGAFLTGKGKLWIDDLELSVKENDAWKQVPLQNSGFEKTTADHLPESWRVNSNLSGYHFAVETTDIKEGTAALVIASTNPADEPAAPMAQALFSQYPKPGEVIQQELVPGISCSVPLALYGNAKHTYPAADSSALLQLTNSISRLGPASTDSLGWRLADIVISWNIFRHFFPYWEDAAAKPDELLSDALQKAATDRNAYDFTKTLKFMTEKLNDGHIRVNRGGDTTRGSFPAIVLTRAENQVVVDKILDSALLHSFSPGDVITAIDGIPVKEMADSAASLISGSPQWKASRTYFEWLEGPANSVVKLTVIHNGSTGSVSLPRALFGQAYYARTVRTGASGWIKPGVFYIDLDKMPMDSINKWMPQLDTAKSIICDLRGYPNRNHEFISHLLTKTEHSKWMFITEIIYPDYQQVTYQEEGWDMQPASPHLNAKIYFLTDGGAISYAESYMGYIKDFRLATIVGAPTAGTNGNVNPFSLPGAYSVSWTGMRVKNHDGSTHHLRGVLPDVRVQRTIKGIREGRDEFLEKALNLAMGSMPVDKKALLIKPVLKESKLN